MNRLQTGPILLAKLISIALNFLTSKQKQEKNENPLFSILKLSPFPCIPLIFNIYHQSLHKPKEKISKKKSQVLIFLS